MFVLSNELAQIFPTASEILSGKIEDTELEKKKEMR